MINPHVILAVNPVALGIGLGALALTIYLVLKFRSRLLLAGQKIRTFLQEVYVELRKSSWPTWIELRDSTIVVIVVVVLLSIYVGAADWVFIKIITWLTKRG